jgi:hypothetical protein
MKLTEQQLFVLVDLVEDKIFMLEDINKVENLEKDEYLIQLEDTLNSLHHLVDALYK